MENEEMIVIKEGTRLEDIEKGSPEYQQAMINKAETGDIYTIDSGVNTNSENEEAVSSNRNADGSIANNNENDQQPQYAGKFKSVEDLERSYLELQSKLGQQTATNTDTNTNTTTNNDTTSNQDNTNKNENNTTNQQLSPEKALEALGMTKEQFDMLIEAQKTVVKNEQLSIFGGEERYNQMIEWGKDNLTDSQKATFDKLIASGDKNDLQFANDFISNLYGNSEEGSEERIGKSLRGTSTNTVSDVYESMAQLIADQKDPRYKNDPAYRNKIMAKLGRSNF